MTSSEEGVSASWRETQEMWFPFVEEISRERKGRIRRITLTLAIEMGWWRFLAGVEDVCA